MPEEPLSHACRQVEFAEGLSERQRISEPTLEYGLGGRPRVGLSFQQQSTLFSASGGGLNLHQVLPGWIVFSYRILVQGL